MAANVPTACRNTRYGCGGTCFPELGHTHCSSCEAANAKEQAAAKPQPAQVLRWPKSGERDRVDKFYHTSEWERFSKTCRSCNPLCQLIVDGVQCRFPSAEVHHLASPRADWQRRMDPANVVCLCPEHHPKSVGEASNSVREYVPTKFILGAIYHHPKHEPLKQGEVRILANGIARIG